MSPDLVFFTTYSCPRCHFALEADSVGPPTWLRCPNCGRASLPPEVVRRSPDAGALDRAHPIGADSDALLINGDPLRPRPMAARPAPSSEGPSPIRLLLGIGFFLTVLFFVFSLLGGDGFRAAGFGIAAAVLLYFLSRPSRQPTPD